MSLTKQLSDFLDRESNPLDLRGNSALGLAATFGHVNNTNALLGMGAFDVNEANSGDWMPLMRASSSRRLLLAQEGIKVSPI